jgi:O-antigen/teichoic acid export membrane protein
MFSFAGWNFIGVSSGVLRDQGGNILVNIFSGPSVNAARGLAVQLNGAIQSFVTNFMTAVNPQITKSYASGEHEYMFSLIRKASRMSFYLLFVLALPVLFNTETVMSLWLKEVPEHSVLFVQLFLVFTLSECISQPLITAMFATGNIRNYQIVVGGLQLLNLPVSYVLLKMGAMPEVTVIVAVVISQICLAARLFMLEKMIGLSVRNFLVRVYFNVLAVATVALVLPVVAALVVPGGPVGFVVKASVAVISAGLSIFLVGCSKQERRDVIGFIKNRLGGK